MLNDINDTRTEPFLTQMAIYGRVAPAVKASKGVDEWQTMEAILVGNRVTVTLNGKRVHDNVAIVGVTGGALDGDELSPGPLMIQGDHEQVWFRKVVITPMYGGIDASGPAAHRRGIPNHDPSDLPSLPLLIRRPPCLLLVIALLGARGRGATRGPPRRRPGRRGRTSRSTR